MVLTQEEDKAYSIRRFGLGTEDFSLIMRLIRNVYGDNYPSQELYTPEKLQLALHEDRLRAFLAVTPNGEPVGYFAHARTAPNPRLWEQQGLMVAPEYSQTGLALSLIEQIENDRPADADGIFSTPVCHHYFSQIAGIKGGQQDCALMLDQVDGSIFQGRTADTSRVALLMNFSEYTQLSDPVFLPAAYVDIIKLLTHPLQPRLFNTVDVLLPGSGLTVKTDKYLPRAHNWFISIQEIGKDWHEFVDWLLLTAKEREVISLQLILNTHKPVVGAAVNLLQQKSFFLAGLAPRWFQTDGLIMQKIFNKTPDYGGLKLYTATARQLLAFIRAEQQSVARLKEQDAYE